MEREFWLQRWEKGQIGFHQPDVHPALAAHWGALGLPRGAPVFVPLCGKTRDMAWLRREGHPVLGVELSPIAARDFFAEHGLTPEVTPEGSFERWSAGGVTILRGDLFDLRPADVGECLGVYDRASLVALPPELRERYAATLRAIMPAGARMLLVTFRYDQREMAGPPFSVDAGEVRRLFGEAWRVRHLSTRDVLARDAHLRERGLTALAEEAHLLVRA